MYTLGCRRDVKGVEKVENPVFSTCDIHGLQSKNSWKIMQIKSVILITSAGKMLLCYSALFEV